MCLTGRAGSVSGREDVDVRGVRVGRDRRLPVVHVRVHDPLPDPARRRIVDGGLRRVRERSGRSRGGERVHPLRGDRILLAAAGLPRIGASCALAEVGRPSVGFARRRCNRSALVHWLRGTSDREEVEFPAPETDSASRWHWRVPLFLPT